MADALLGLIDAHDRGLLSSDEFTIAKSALFPPPALPEPPPIPRRTEEVV